MGSIRVREGRYQANVRRKGYATVTKTFTSKEVAKRWIKSTEVAAVSALFLFIKAGTDRGMSKCVSFPTSLKQSIYIHFCLFRDSPMPFHIRDLTVHEEAYLTTNCKAQTQYLLPPSLCDNMYCSWHKICNSQQSPQRESACRFLQSMDTQHPLHCCSL